MVSISLRSYLNEINDLIDQRQIDEAIANCRHILETYPKHVDTYRLLGKSYLEEQRYSDASDILQRVLSSVPEDFISQVGMSIIREDEGNLDSAIYHMERAFETQPSNHAIQDELRRLHSQRDGVDLKRVRLTRGALARMYAHGNLYEQAISELMAALSEDPNRYDLQSLLADMYYHTDKKVDAAETCTKILEKLPHCLNANRLLTIILEESGRPEEAHRYRQRWAALDPYAAFVGEQYALIEQVPDKQVTLDKFEWDPSSLLDGEGGQPAWASSLGVSLSGEEQPSEPLPDWLSDTTAQPEETPLDMDADLDDDEEFRPTEMLPESLAAGGTFEEDSSVIDGDHIDLFPSTDDDEEEWLSSMDTPDVETRSGEPDLFADMESESDSGEDWLAPSDEPARDTEGDLFAAPAADDDGEDDWLASLDPSTDAPIDESVEETDLFAAPSGEDDTGGDWLASLDTPDEEPTPAAATDEETSPDDWLGSLESDVEEPAATPDEPKAEEELPEFLKEAGWEPGSGTFDESKPVDFSAADETDEPEDEIVQGEVPDWIQQMAPTEDASPEPEAEADPEWMKSMQAPSEADSPAWLKELGSPEAESEEEDSIEAPPMAEESAPVDAPISMEEHQPETDLPAEVPATGIEIEPDEMDMAWLENLASKQGIPDEEMVTTVEQRAEITEDHKPTTGELEEAPAPEEVQTDSDWLQELGREKDQEETVEPAGEETADWLSSIADDEEISAQPGPDDDDTISRFLAAKESDDSADEPTVEIAGDEEGDWDGEIDLDITPEPAAPVSPVDEEADDLDMDWLSEISDEAAAEAAPEEPTDPEPEMAAPATGELADDDWLAELDQPKAGTAEPMQDISPVDQEADSLDTDWLKQISEEATAEAAEEAPQAESPLSAREEAAEEDNWLASLDQPDTETVPSAEASSVVDEEADDLDMDWLSEISDEAAAEAASDEAVSEMPAPEAAEPAGEDLFTEPEQPEAEATQPSAAAPVDEEQDDFDTSWLDDISEEAASEAVAEVGSEEVSPEMPAPEATQPSAATPVDEEEDDFDTSWLDDISEEAASEAVAAAGAEEFSSKMPETEAEELAGDDWLAELDQPEGEATQPSVPSPVDEEEDDLDMDWLDDLSEEAAAEAAGEPDLEMPAPSTEEPAEDDLLTEPEQPEAEVTQPSAIAPVDEEEDDLDMDWLDDLSEEAAAEAAGEPDLEMPAPSAGEPAKDDLLTEPEQVEAEPTQPSAAAPVDEEQDDFDTSWLDDISEEPAAEAAPESSEQMEEDVPDSTEDAPVQDNLLADLEDALEEASWPTTAMLTEDDLEDREDDLGAEVPPESPAASIETPAEEGTYADTAGSESPETPPSPVDEDRDDFNTAWLDDIGAQAALEAAGTESPPTMSEDEDSGDDWLTRIEEEDELAYGQSISDTDAWLLSMEEADEADAQPSIADTGQWLDTLGIEQEKSAPEEEISEPEPEPLEMAEPDPPTELPREEELETAVEPEEAPAADVLPTQDDEWKPEAEIEAEEPQSPEAQPEPPSPAEPVAADNDLESARQEVSSGNMEQALTTYGTLIKKGKNIDEIISDLTDATLRHPINVRLWQTLGDAYMRIDNLQDALDAYSKAEDLLR